MQVYLYKITCSVVAGGQRDSQVSGDRQHRVNDDQAVRLMQYLTIGKLLIVMLALCGLSLYDNISKQSVSQLSSSNGGSVTR